MFFEIILVKNYLVLCLSETNSADFVNFTFEIFVAKSLIIIACSIITAYSIHTKFKIIENYKLMDPRL